MSANQQNEFESSYQQIKSDVRKVIVINLLFIVLLVALHIIEQKTGFISKLF